MKPLRIIGIAAATIGLVCIGAVILRSRPDYSDGAAALANVPNLRKGMSIFEAIGVLHPVKSKTAPSLSYSLGSSDRGGVEVMHALTDDRYLVVRTAKKTIVGTANGGTKFSYEQPCVESWEVREGAPPREDVHIGRVLSIAGVDLNY